MYHHLGFLSVSLSAHLRTIDTGSDAVFCKGIVLIFFVLFVAANWPE